MAIERERARRRLPLTLWRVAHRKLDQINRATELHQLSVPPNNHLKLLKKDRKGQKALWDSVPQKKLRPPLVASSEEC